MKRERDIGDYLSRSTAHATLALAHWREGHLREVLDEIEKALDDLKTADAMTASRLLREGESV